MDKIALALGSNDGDRLRALRAAVTGLAPFVDIDALSPVYETDPLYVTEQPTFANMAVIGRTKLTALALLWNVKRLEMELGRTPTFRYGPRIIDIDLIFVGDQIITTDELTVPHQHMDERTFVLKPLADIAPEWMHPKLKRSVKDLLKALPPDTDRFLGPLP